MSRIGKKIIKLPADVQVSFDSGHLSVKGPKGVLSLTMAPGFEMETKDDVLSLLCLNGDKAKHGLFRSLVANMIKGVSVGFEKDLELVGVGYRVQLQGKSLQFAIGYSRPVIFDAPDGITFHVEGQNKVKIIGIDNQLVGQVASKIREIRTPDVYKGKGIRYSTEVIRKKQGKSVKK